MRECPRTGRWGRVGPRSARWLACLGSLAAFGMSAAPAQALSYSQQTLGFSGLNSPFGLALDRSGNVFVAENGDNRVLELAAGGGSQVTLAFTGLRTKAGRRGRWVRRRVRC